MKYTLSLSLALVATWLLWSGHFENAFLLVLGGLSCLFCLFLSLRMRIVDEEGAPVQLGLRPFTNYAPWLIKEIWKSNVLVAKVILSKRMALKRNMVDVTATQKTELGRVILANSITLTPGTVSVAMDENTIAVHALSFEGTAEEMAGEMDRRVRELEGLS